MTKTTKSKTTTRKSSEREPAKRRTAVKAKASPAKAKVSPVKIKSSDETSEAKRPRRKAAPTDDAAKEIALKAARYALEKKADDVHVLDLRGVTSMTDFFVIATGSSDRQVKAIAENVIAEMRDKEGVTAWRSEGWDGLRWVIIDFVDFVVHVFQSDARQYYNVERLWADAPMIEVKDEPTKSPATRTRRSARSDETEKDHKAASKIKVVSDFKQVGSAS